MENSTELTMFLKEKFAAIHGDNSLNVDEPINETVTTTKTKTKLDYNANEQNGFGIMNGNNNSNSSDDDSHLAKSTSTDADQPMVTSPMVDTNNNNVTLLGEEDQTFSTKEIYQNIVSNSAILEAKSSQSAKIKLENSSMKTTTTVEIHNNNNNNNNSNNDDGERIELAKNELMNELKRQLSVRSEKSSIRQDIKLDGESDENDENHLKQPDLAALSINEDYRADNGGYDGGHNDGDNQRENVDQHKACISSSTEQQQSISNNKDNAANSLDNNDDTTVEVIAAININNDSNHNGNSEQSPLGNKTQDNDNDDNVQSSVTAEPELTIPSIENSATSTSIDSDPPKPSPRTTTIEPNQLNHNSEPITAIASAATLPRSHKQLDRSISAFQSSVRLRSQNKPEQFSRSISNRDVAFTLEASKEEPKITRERVSRMSQLWKDRIITAKDDNK